MDYHAGYTGNFHNIEERMLLTFLLVERKHSLRKNLSEAAKEAYCHPQPRFELKDLRLPNQGNEKDINPKNRQTNQIRKPNLIVE